MCILLIMGGGGSIPRKKATSARQVSTDRSVRRLQTKRRVGEPRFNGIGYVTIPLCIQEDLPPPPEDDDAPDDSTRKFAWFVEDLDMPGEWELYPPDACERLDEARRSNMTECLVVVKKRMCTVNLVKMEHLCAGSNARPRQVKRVEVEVSNGTTTYQEKRKVPNDPFAEDSPRETPSPMELFESEENAVHDVGSATTTTTTKAEPEKVPNLVRSILTEKTTSYAMSLTSNGTTVFSGTKAQMLRWDLKTAEVTAEFDVQDSVVLSNALSHDERHVVAGRSDCTASMHSVDGSTSCVFSGHQRKVYGVDFLLGDDRVATASMDCTVRIWDASTSTCVQTIGCSAASVFTVVTSDLNNHFALSAGDDNIIYAHDLRSGGDCVIDRFIDHASTVWCCAVRNDEQVFASCGIDGVIRVWDIRNSSSPTLLLRHHEKPVHMVKFTPRGRAILSCGRDDNMRLTDAMTGEPLWRAVAHRRFVYRIAFSKEKKFILSSGGDHRVNVWNYDYIDRM